MDLEEPDRFTCSKLVICGGALSVIGVAVVIFDEEKRLYGMNLCEQMGRTIVDTIKLESQAICNHFANLIAPKLSFVASRSAFFGGVGVPYGDEELYIQSVFNLGRGVCEDLMAFRWDSLWRRLWLGETFFSAPSLDGDVGCIPCI